MQSLTEKYLKTSKWELHSGVYIVHYKLDFLKFFIRYPFLSHKFSVVIQISAYPQPHYKPVFLDEILYVEQSIPSLKRHNSMCVFQKGGGRYVLLLLIFVFITQRLTLYFSLGTKVIDVWIYKFVFVVLKISFKTYKIYAYPVVLPVVLRAGISLARQEEGRRRRKLGIIWGLQRKCIPFSRRAVGMSQGQV